MSPEQRLRKAFELSELTRGLLTQGLRQRFPNLNDAELRALVRKRLDACRNRNY